MRKARLAGKAGCGAPSASGLKTMMRKSYLDVGRVAGAQGVAGSIRVKVFSGDPTGLLGVRTVRLSADDPGRGGRVRDFPVRAAKPLGGFAVFSLEGIEAAEAAKEWSGSIVSVLREELPPPAEDEYYWVDLIGCEVTDAEGARVGEITGLTEGPAHDWIAVRRDDGELLLPMVSEFIREVDIAGRRVVVALPKGW